MRVGMRLKGPAAEPIPDFRPWEFGAWVKRRAGKWVCVLKVSSEAVAAVGCAVALAPWVVWTVPWLPASGLESLRGEAGAGQWQGGPGLGYVKGQLA